MALDIGTLVAKVKVDDSDFDKKTSNWSTRGAAVGSAFGNIAADAIGQAASALGTFVTDAVAASDATDKFKKTLEFAGLDGSTIEGLSASTRKYADETVYSLTDIQSITAQLASNGVKDYDVLAESLGNLNAIAGGNAETYGRVGQVLTQTAGAGKLTTENWNQLAEAIPGASGVLMDALLKSGAYTGNFRDAMAEGQITADEFNAALMQVGSDPIAVEAAKSTDTMEGAIGGLQASILGIIMDLVTKFKPTMTDIINTLSGVVAWISDNADWLGPLAAGIGVVVGMVIAFTAAQWLLNAALTANPIGLVIVAIGLLLGAIFLLVQNWDAVVAWLSEVWQGFVDWFVGVMDGFVAWWNGMWAGFGSWVTEVWNGFIGWITGVWSGFVSWLTGVGDGIASWWNGLWSGIGSFIQNTWNGFVGWVEGIAVRFVMFILTTIRNFQNGWNSTWAMIGAVIATAWNNITAFFTGLPGQITGMLSGAGQWLYSIGRDIIDGLWKGLKSIWTNVSNWFNDTFGGIIDTVAGIFGIASPSRVFRYHIAGNIGKGMVLGLQDYEGPINDQFDQMMTVPATSAVPGQTAETTAAPVHKSFTYVAAENQSLTSEEALFAALGSPRAKD